MVACAAASVLISLEEIEYPCPENRGRHLLGVQSKIALDTMPLFWLALPKSLEIVCSSYECMMSESTGGIAVFLALASSIIRCTPEADARDVNKMAPTNHSRQPRTLESEYQKT
mmetsp:Transcript_11032/g.23371  ORF Transcript_11032/g.23371 Transcript_11032/m.23371 type:complete len:114 (+) Transcript_11032:2757-3098(+)